MESIKSILSRLDSTDESPPANLSKKFTPPVTFTSDPLEYWYDKKYLGLGSEMSRTQKRLVEEIVGDWPNIKYHDVNIVAGQRSGKTSRLGGPLMSWYAHWLLSFDPYEGTAQTRQFGIQEKDTVYLVCLACSEEQAERTVFSDFAETIERSSFWKKYLQWLRDLETNHEVMRLWDPNIEAFTERRINRHDLYNPRAMSHEFRWHNAVAELQNTSSASAAGRTSLFVVFDETARLPTAGTERYEAHQHRTAEALVTTMRNSLITLKAQGGMFMSISSPQQEDDYSIKLLCKSDKIVFGPGSSHKIRDLVARMRTTDLTPTSIGIHMTTYDMLDLNEIDAALDSKKVKLLEGIRSTLDGERLNNPEAFERDILACPTQSEDRFFAQPDRWVGCMRDEPNMFQVLETQDKLQAINHADEVSTLHVVGLVVEKALRPFNPAYHHFWHGDGGKSRNSFAVAGGHAEPIIPDGVDARNPILAEDHAVQFKTVIDFTLEWIPGRKVVHGTSRKERFEVSFGNVENVVAWMLAMKVPGAFTFDHWGGTTGFVQQLMSRGVNSYELTLKLENWEEFRRRIYSSLVSMFWDFNEREVSRSYEQVKRAIQKNKSVDFVKPSSSSDLSHGDLVTAICGVDTHVADHNAKRNVVDRGYATVPMRGSVGVHAGARTTSPYSIPPVKGTMSPVGAWRTRSNLAHQRRMRGGRRR